LLSGESQSIWIGIEVRVGVGLWTMPRGLAAA